MHVLSGSETQDRRLSLSPDQVLLVAGTWRSIVPIRDTFADLLFRKLFALDASLRALFKGDLREQGRNFVAMMSIVVRNLDKPQAVERALAELGARHVRYGVRREHYETLRTAFMLTLGLSLGDALTPQARQAWERAFDLVAAAMLGGAAAA